MHFSIFTAVLAASAIVEARSSLWVDNAPDYVRPYVIEHYAPAQAVSIGSQIYRFPVTGASSGNELSLVSTASPGSDSLGVLPHLHEKHFENFFALKGRVQLWTSKDGSDNGRLLTAGDYAACPRNTTHTFQFLDPDSEITGILYPGGFEKLFLFLADNNYTSSIDSPFVPATSNNPAGDGSSLHVIETLETFDVHSQLDYSPRRDFINGSAPVSNWHSGADSLANNSHTPYYIAKDHGPKRLSTGSFYQIIQPFVTPVQSGDLNFTKGTITMSRPRSDTLTVPTTVLPNHTVFQILEGAMTLTMQNETVTLINGDVAFIPGGTPFQYRSKVAFTRFIYTGAGVDTLGTRLLRNATQWDYAVFPVA